MKSKLAQLGWLAVLLGATFWAGASLQPQPAATAEKRKDAKQEERFLSGAERSLPILREMSDTLKRMEACLLRIEKLQAPAAKR